jgi:Tfp pilus assembly PilM family ATPase
LPIPDSSEFNSYLVPKLISKIVEPRYPSTAIGLERGVASLVCLEKARANACTLKRAAIFDIADSLIHPSFDEPNIENRAQLAGVLRELATSTGLLRHKRWSVSLPEATTRTLVLTMETQAQSGAELQEVLKWKMERGFGTPLEELSISKDRLQKDSQGRDRYLAIAIRKEVLAEYEAVLASLGWRSGLILPRHLGEAQWLVRNGSAGDALLLSGSAQGFTAVIFRNRQPLIVRSVTCTEEECDDEFYRLLLFYRDRRTADLNDVGVPLSRLMVVGEGLTKERVGEIVNETTGADLRPLDPEDLGLILPGRDMSFAAIAAPTGLATLSF